MTTIADRYRELHPTSLRLYQEAQRSFPSGITHDSRYFEPFPLYIERASGSRKWDVDGNELIDYVMGHGALLLGHAYPDVVTAVREQAAKLTHPVGESPLALEWARWVQRLVPSAERVKFTSSGTEATHMAMRLARAYTGKTKIIKFYGHFHGWHDYATVAHQPPYDVPVSVGVPKEVLGTMVALPADIDAVRQVLESDDDIAGVILEPCGASTGAIPLPPNFLADLRALTAKHNVVLIFDEVVTGFRMSPGGAQAKYGVVPDLTTMAKILAGGLPGGAVAGRADIMALLEFKSEDPQWNRFKRIAHPGTFNANPLSAAAGVACLKVVSQGEAHAHADALGEQIRNGLNQVLGKLGVKGRAYGEGSVFHVFIGDGWSPENAANVKMNPRVVQALGQGMRNLGVDLFRTMGFVSSAHSPADVDHTLQAFEETVKQMRREGLV
ncbi:MAG: aspartate aminotransferase family protein [Chloroflexota bacterium]